MDLENLFMAAVILIILLLAACMMMLMLYRKCRLENIRDKKALLEQNKKTDFFTNMTHELKTPLSVILGGIQLMEMKINGLSEEENTFRKNMKIIKYNCYRLLRLTNNLLDLSKMEAGYVVLKPVNCDLNLLLDEIVQSVIPYAVQKQLNLQYSIPPAAVPTAVDIEKMERIMLNLLSNAIKFTKPGGIINVSSYTSEDRVFISVKDSGSGIPVENQEEVFKRFKQVGNNPSAENEGSGIGLSLVKSFIDLHHGGIKVISEQGKGCEFIIDLPICHVDEEFREFVAEDLNIRIAEAAKIEFSILHSVAS